MSYPLIIPIRDADFGYGLLPWAKGPEWESVDPHKFTLVDSTGKSWDFEIPGRYRFNKASTPPILWGPPFNYTPDGICTKRSLEHDFLCDILIGGSEWLKAQYGGSLPSIPPAAEIHRYFQNGIIEDGMREGRAKAWGRMVSWFGPKGKLKFWQR
jgi:hypothetical protein